jgi:prepilin peptidase CpaA
MSFQYPAQIGLLLTLVTVAAIYDLRYRRIPNWLTLPGLLLGIALNSFLADHWLDGLMFSLKGLGLGFGLYFGLYALRAMGAGDVKLMAVVGAIAGWQYWLIIFVFTALLGGLLAVVFSILKKRLKTTFWNVGFILSEMKQGRPAYLGKEELDVKSNKAMRMPHGAVIAASTFLFLAVYYSKLGAS